MHNLIRAKTNSIQRTHLTTTLQMQGRLFLI